MSWIVDAVKYSVRRSPKRQNGDAVHVHTAPSGRKSLDVSEVRASKPFKHLITTIERAKASAEPGGRTKIKIEPSVHGAKVRRAHQRATRRERANP